MPKAFNKKKESFIGPLEEPIKHIITVTAFVFYLLKIKSFWFSTNPDRSLLLPEFLFTQTCCIIDKVKSFYSNFENFYHLAIDKKIKKEKTIFKKYYNADGRNYDINYFSENQPLQYFKKIMSSKEIFDDEIIILSYIHFSEVMYPRKFPKNFLLKKLSSKENPFEVEASFVSIMRNLFDSEGFFKTIMDSRKADIDEAFFETDLKKDENFSDFLDRMLREYETKEWKIIERDFVFLETVLLPDETRDKLEKSSKKVKYTCENNTMLKREVFDKTDGEYKDCNWKTQKGKIAFLEKVIEAISIADKTNIQDLLSTIKFKSIV